MKRDALVEKYYFMAQSEALKIIEHEARKILHRHSNLDEFVMAMGSAFFTTKAGTILQLDKRKYFEPIDKIMCDWNTELKMGGEPMRFTAKGHIVTDW